MVEPTGTPYQPALPPNEYLEKALSLSAEVRKQVTAELDLSYGTAGRHRLDVYLPDFPTVYRIVELTRDSVLSS